MRPSTSAVKLQTADPIWIEKGILEYDEKIRNSNKN